MSKYYPPKTPNTYITPLPTGTPFEFVSAYTIFPYLLLPSTSDRYYLQVVSLNNVEIFRNLLVLGKFNPEGQNIGFKTILSSGEYSIYYELGFRTKQISGNYDYDVESKATYRITAIENHLPLKKWTVTDVVNRLCDLAEPIRKGEAPRFRFNKEQAAQFDKILSPQFSFTKETLRECLQEVGRFLHGEPRLTPKKGEDGVWYYEVSYEMYARQDHAGVYTRPYIKETVSQLIDSYTSYLDSNAENLVNQLDKYSGVIVEPYRDGAQSVRTENAYVRIEDTNMLIATRYPIYSVDKLEYVYAQDGAVNSVDITPYLFEKSVYDTQLSSYQEQYPYSKAYGLYYAQGSKNIGGLNFKVDSAAAGVFKDPAINNILQEAAGITVGSNDYPKMCFRVTYTPFYNARVAQTKSYFKEHLRPAALIFNQQANVMESRYYGENLKGAIARLGNVDKSLTYILYNVNLIPQAGQMFDRNYYISAVAVAMYPTCFLVTIGLSKDFNRISAYIGINSEKRYSEISQNQAVERNTLWREYIVVGTQETPDSDCLIGNKMLGAIADTFCLQEKTERFDHGVAPLSSSPEPYKFGVVYTVEINGELINAELISEADGGSDNYYLVLENSTASGAGRVMISFSKILYPLSNVCAWGTSYKGNELNAINLPVISSAFGNSISFSWQYEDNYSAGATAFHQSNGNVTGYFQSDASYTDYYGRLYYYNFDLQAEGPTVTADNVTTLGLSLPNGTKPTQSSGFVSTIGQQPLVMRKDNREALQCNFQIDFVTNLENLIIGSALASYCPAVRGRDNTLTAKLYVFDTELNKFTDHVEAYENVDLSQMESAEVSVDMYDGYFTVSAGRLPKTESGATSGKSWAIITNQYKKPAVQVEDEFGNISEQQEVMGGDLLIGQNIAVTAGQAFTPIYFTKKREIFDKTVWKDRR